MIRLALPRLSASIMISCSISHWFSGAGWLCSTNASQPRTDSSNRTKISPLAKSRAVCAVTVDVELLGDLLGQLGVRAAGEEHQVLAVVGPVGAHVCALAGRGSIRANRT